MTSQSQLALNYKSMTFNLLGYLSFERKDSSMTGAQDCESNYLGFASSLQNKIQHCSTGGDLHQTDLTTFLWGINRRSSAPQHRPAPLEPKESFHQSEEHPPRQI